MNLPMSTMNSQPNPNNPTRKTSRTSRRGRRGSNGSTSSNPSNTHSSDQQPAQQQQTEQQQQKLQAHQRGGDTRKTPKSPIADSDGGGVGTTTPVLKRVMLGLKSPIQSIGGSGGAPHGHVAVGSTEFTAPLPADLPLSSPSTPTSNQYRKKSHSTPTTPTSNQHHRKKMSSASASASSSPGSMASKKASSSPGSIAKKFTARRNNKQRPSNKGDGANSNNHNSASSIQSLPSDYTSGGGGGGGKDGNASFGYGGPSDAGDSLDLDGYGSGGRGSVFAPRSSGATTGSRSRDSALASSTHTFTGDFDIPMLYRHGRKCQWEDLTKQLETSSDDISYIYPKDGTNTLHMVVMSRTGYINTFKKSKRTFAEAPLSLVEKILTLDPDSAKVRCTLNGYTPLTYACLVCTKEYDVEHMAPMIRLFLKHAPDSIDVFTKEGLSPIDVHIVSYSQHHKAKEEIKKGLGHSSTNVLRLLLAHRPELANLRLKGEKVEGPLEYLYRCNTTAFSEAVLNEIYDSDEEGTLATNFTLPERRQQVVDAVSKWWIWKWAVMILKYGSWRQKHREARFSAVHTAAGQVGCPIPLLSITLYAFPRQVKQTLESIDNVINLPLHTVCSWPCHQDYTTSSDAVVSSRKSMAISRIMEEYPDAAKETNSKDETCLELALKTGTTWDHGVRRLVRAYPKAIKIQSRTTGLYPFMTAAAAAPKASFRKHALKSVRTIYGVLRSNPKVLVQCHQKGVQQREEIEQKRAIMFALLEEIE